MTTADVAETQLSSRDTKVIATLLVATFVVILNETIMGVALPVLMVDLDLTAGTVQWLTTAFMLTMAVVIPTTGFLLQRLSTRTVYAAALGLFSAGTLLAGLAPGFWVLLLGRIIQASGTAIMLPLLMTTILTLVPLQRRGAVMGNVSIAISVAPAIGPTLSGLILQYLSWRFMFLLVLPIALAALAYGLRGLVNVNADGDQPLDIVSVLLSVPGFGGIVFGLSQLGESGRGSSAWIAPVSVVVGAVCLVLFVLRQRALIAGKGPLLDLRAFEFPMFRRGVALLCIAAVALFGAIILLPIYFQNVRGLSTLETGALLLPGGLLMGLLGPLVGRLFDQHGPRWLSTGGATLLVLTMLALTQVTPHTPIALLLGIHLVLSTGLAFLFTPAFTTALNPLPPKLYSHGSAILSTLQQVAGAAGVALLVTIMTLRMMGAGAAGADEIAAEVAGLHLAFLVAAGIGLVAVGLALSLRRTEAAPATPVAATASVSRVSDADQTTSQRIAVVTGGGSGIGAASAVALARDGWTVVVAGRRGGPLTELVAEHVDLGMDCCVTDVTDPTSVHNLFARTVNRYGRVDLLFNNAGRGAWSAEIDELEVKDWKAVVDVNLTGAFLCTREAFRVMRRQDPQGGRIINNGSISAYVPRPLSVAYTATKHAITGLTRSTALDGRRYGIACGQLDIGNAATDMTTGMAEGILQADFSTAVEPRMDVADVARAVVYMASLPPEANVLTMTVMATTMPYVGRG